ncbi:MAG: CHC2 zinc finger domain-containing protein [Desulfuromusa sp.]
MNILELAQNHIPDLKKKTAKEWAGPCPGCGGTDRFLVWPERAAFFCRGCQRSGDALQFLREFENKSCPDAHETLGLDCSNHFCPGWEKCRKGARANGESVRRVATVKSVEAPAQIEDKIFKADAATPPEDLWKSRAAALIETAHAVLLETPEQLAYLDKRGLPLAAVKQYQLGWIDANLFRSRKSWGLPEELKENKQPKKLLIPAGIVIPFFDVAGDPQRIRIRRSETYRDSGRYYWLPGSGNDVPVIGETARAFVVVESDLDALLLHHHAGDIVGAIPLGTCSAKPKESAMEKLRDAIAILVALDSDQAGAKSAAWWLKNFNRAERWPVPAGKDPGEYYQDHGGDLRSWLLAGLPAQFHISLEIRKAPLPEHVKGTTVNGHGYVVAYHHQHVEQLQRHYPDDVVFSPEEMAALKGMSQGDAELMLLVKQNFNGKIIETKPLDPTDQPPLPPEPEAIQEELIY